jgi:hypothetical protein
MNGHNLLKGNLLRAECRNTSTSVWSSSHTPLPKTRWNSSFTRDQADDPVFANHFKFSLPLIVGIDEHSFDKVVTFISIKKQDSLFFQGFLTGLIDI